MPAPAGRRQAITVKFTRNFEASLEAIEAFWVDAGFPQGYDCLLDEIGDAITPTLERFPAIGRPFAHRPPDSVEALSKQEKLTTALACLGDDSDIREYVMEDYLLLYAVIQDVVYLLSIRHHKQLSFDFAHLWKDRA